ncbi:MAG: hypothetical protein JSW28_05915 [Thermoplasmata archaeon]|nr:MAG: hypothetical protein JSW28_05915 [Thermoplasmata archaeon]
MVSGPSDAILYVAIAVVLFAVSITAIIVAEGTCYLIGWVLLILVIGIFVYRFIVRND